MNTTQPKTKGFKKGEKASLVLFFVTLFIAYFTNASINSDASNSENQLTGSGDTTEVVVVKSSTF